MAGQAGTGHHKIAEKLTILNERGVGMLTRLYNLKKTFSSAETRPGYLTDKQFEPALKHINRKFPNIDSRGNAAAFQPVNAIKTDIFKSLSLYYYTFVDVLDFKDHVYELLTVIDTCHVRLDVTLNFDLTSSYLDLICTYLSILTMITRIEDRKSLLTLYNFAHEQMQGHPDPAYPRLGQMILNYDQPLKQLSEDFNTHSAVLRSALLSLHSVYAPRNQTAEVWRNAQTLSLLAAPNDMIRPYSSKTMPCEFLSVDGIERWIVFGFMLLPRTLSEPECSALWQQALRSSWVMPLFREEVLHVHGFWQSALDAIKEVGKGNQKRINDCFTTAINNSPPVHRERRKFLRTALRELTLVVGDQPGLLGPKMPLILNVLSLARDEVHWMLRHHNNPPPRRSNVRFNFDEFFDRQLPELLFLIEEMRGLIKKYNQVIQRYYVQYLAGFDHGTLTDRMQELSSCPEDECTILSACAKTMGSLSLAQVEQGEVFDFRGLRLDWFRLQAYTSVGRASLQLFEHRELAEHLNLCTFHTRMVDALDEVLVQTSDLGIYCFYTSLFEQQFKQCMEFPAQHRYSICFPLVCAHFINGAHSLCPEERQSICNASIQYTNWFLKEIAEEVNQVIVAIYDEHCKMGDKLLPKNAAVLIAQMLNRKKGGGGTNRKRQQLQQQDVELPGEESRRKCRENFTRMDKLHMALTELCFALNYCHVIHVWEHGFVPREYFTSQLELRFNTMLVGIMMYNPDTSEVAKPSELLAGVYSVMSVLQSLENYIQIDVARIFNSVLPQQTQPTDCFTGEKTITANYTQWYLEVLLCKVSSGSIVFSPNHQAFVSLSSESQLPFNAQEYADINELRALAELLGPYGMLFLSERLVWHISSQLDELKKLVLNNVETLRLLRKSFDKPDVMREQFRRLQKPGKGNDVDILLQRMTIIGVLLEFRNLAQQALHEVLKERIPFMINSIQDFRRNVPLGSAQVVNEMASAAGMPCHIDTALCNALRAHKPEIGQNNYEFACLLMVFVAVSIPRLASQPNSKFNAALQGHGNNAHCLCTAVTSLAGALFTVYAPDRGQGQGQEVIEVEDRLKEFLALASSSLLRLGLESDKDSIKNRESVYILLDLVVKKTPFLTQDLLESCFPYALLREAYHSVYSNVQQI